jgi:hypothetical protein
MVYVVFKIIKNTNNEAGYAYPGDVFLRTVADTYINKIGKIGNETFGDGTLKIAGKGPAMSTYISYARHYKPRLVYFLPHFSLQFIYLRSLEMNR